MVAVALLWSAVIGAIAAQQESTPPPVRVTIASDVNTWVIITNLRAPQRFQSATLYLGPGLYEIVGRRRGYRDVTKSLQIRSEWPQLR